MNTALKTDDICKIFEEGPTLVDFLPYAEEADGVFLMVDGSIGMVWEFLPLEGDVLAAEALGHLAERVGSLLGRCGPRFAIQVLCWGDSDMAPILSKYRSMTSASQPGIALFSMEAKVRHYQQEEGASWSAAENMLKPRRLRYFLALRYFPHFDMPVIPGRARVYGASFAAKQHLSERSRAEWERVSFPLESGFRGMGFAIKPCDRHNLTTLLYRVLNPQRSRRYPLMPHDTGFIRDHVLYNAPVAKNNGFLIDGMETRVVTLKELPPLTRAGMFTLGQYGTALTTICRDFLVVFNMMVPDQGKALQQLKFQKAFAFLRRSSSMGDISEEAVHKKEELSRVITETFQSGKALVHVRAHFIPFATTSAEADQAAEAALQVLARAGAEGLKEEIIAPSLFLSALPLNFDHSFEAFVRRNRRMLADNAADILPLFAGVRGSATPALLYLDRQGSPVTLDFFDSSTNPHTLIIGASGAGKSFLTNDLIYQYARLDSWFFVLDKGNSYQKTCTALKGKYLSFDMESPVRINPFLRKPDSGMLAFLVEMLSVMASGGDERDRLTREDRGVLQVAILEAYEEACGREMVLSDVVAMLRKDAVCQRCGALPEMGVRLALRLAPFTAGGPFGAFFDGPDQMTREGRFMVFELGALSRYPDLQLVVLLNIMFFITNIVNDPAMLGARKFFVIDEAWQLLRTGNTAEFIGNAFKTFRKYRCAAVAITQEAGDLLHHPAGQAIIANTANKIFLRQDPGVIDRLCREMALDREHAAVLRSLRTVKGSYAEALLMADGTSGVIRLVPDPVLYWAATSDPKDNELLYSFRKDFDHDLGKAILHCSREYPYGTR